MGGKLQKYLVDIIDERKKLVETERERERERDRERDKNKLESIQMTLQLTYRC